MIAEGINDCTFKIGTLDAKAVIKFSNLCFHPFEVFDDGSDAIGLFYSKLASVADLQTFFELRS